jgi:OFA family oxalate/formate antiporter-like MFS transporter
MKRYLVLIAGVITQMVLGSIYSWSQIATRLEAGHNLQAWQTQLLYGTAIGVFALGTLFSGPMVRKWGPKVLTFISSSLFVGGWILASISIDYFWVLFVAISIVVGLAISFGYVVPLSTSTAWFPRNKGTVTGLAVMGFGGGAILSSWVIQNLSDSGWAMAEIFLFMGVAGGILLLISAFLQNLPTDSPLLATTAKKRTDFSFLKTMPFWFLFVIMFLSSIGGLMVIGSVGSIAGENNLVQYSTWSVTVLALGNAIGRLGWGALMDKLKEKTITFSLLTMSLGFVMLLFNNGNPAIFLAAVFLCGTQFGAALVVYAAYSERYFGHGAIARVYPYIFLAYGIAAVFGPTLSGLIADVYSTYEPVLIGSIFLPLIAAALFYFNFKKSAQDLSTKEAQTA